MANSPIITLHYDESKSFSFLTPIATAHSHLVQHISAIFNEKLENCLLLIESSHKIVESAKDLEKALRDAGTHELILLVQRKRPSTIPLSTQEIRMSLKSQPTLSNASPLQDKLYENLRLLQSVEISHESDFSLAALQLSDVCESASFNRLILKEATVRRDEIYLITELIRLGNVLQELSITRCTFTYEVAIEIMEAAQMKGTFTVLKFEGVGLSEPVFRTFQHMLSSQMNLRRLEIGSTVLSDSELLSVFAILSAKQSFVHLSFRTMNLQSLMTDPLLLGFRKILTVETLELIDCGLSSSDLLKLLPSLDLFPLHNLNLSHNQLTSEMCPAFASYLSRSKRLGFVSLNDNHISEDGAKILMKGLGEGGAHVNLMGNQINRDSTNVLMRESAGSLLFTTYEQLDHEQVFESRCACKCVLI